MVDVYLRGNAGHLATDVVLYDSAPATVTVLGGPVWQPTRTRRVLRDRGARRYRVTVTGKKATITVRLAQTFTLTARALTRPLRASGAATVTATRSGSPGPLRTAGQATAVTRCAVRTTDHRHLTLPWPLLDLLTESWD